MKHLKNCFALRREGSVLESFCDVASGEAIPLGFARAALSGSFRRLILKIDVPKLQCGPEDTNQKLQLL